MAESPEGCEFTLPGAGVTVKGRASARPQDLDGATPLTLSATESATYELGMRERDHGIRIQPFPDP